MPAATGGFHYSDGGESGCCGLVVFVSLLFVVPALVILFRVSQPPSWLRWISAIVYAVVVAGDGIRVMVAGDVGAPTSLLILRFPIGLVALTTAAVVVDALVANIIFQDLATFGPRISLIASFLSLLATRHL
jgi:hypothetical protein